jgi:hypothetical protein
LRRRAFALLPILAALVVIGCGGSGGAGTATGGGNGGNGGGGNTTAPVGIFITDNLNNGYSQVWVNIQKVELLSSSGPRAVFNNADGVTVDLKTLRDGTGARFQFLSAESVPIGTYTGVRLTLDKDLVLFPTGSATGQERVFAQAAVGAETATFDINFSAPQNLGISGDDLIVDFDLSQWTDDGTKVTAVIVEGDDTGFSSENRHESAEVKGTISGLGGTIPNVTFNLDLAAGGTIQVVASSSTNVFRNDAVLAVLSSGQFVEVHGTYDPNTRKFQATSIEIENSNQQNEAKVEGEPADVNASAGTFSIAPSFVRAFLPTEASVNVVTTDSTIYLANSGLPITKAAFFEVLATAPSTEVEGTYNAETNTFTARKAKLDDEGANQVQVRGAPSQVNTLEQTFKVQATVFGGIFLPVNAVVTVATTVQTEFLDDDNNTLTSTQFYAAAANAAAVEVEGTYDANNNRLLAKKVKLEDQVNANQVEVEGISSNGNVGALTFSVTLQSWLGGLFTNGQLVNVAIQEGAELMDDNNNVITADQLFTAIGSGSRVDVRGRLDGGVLKADRVRLDSED